MLIPDLTLTPGLAERLRACGDREERLIVWSPTRTSVALKHLDDSELSEHERIRVEGVLAAHKVEPL